MPIRFRCVYCDKLLGIATRKAGTVVNCPQCGQPLIVPSPEPQAVQPAAATSGPPASPPSTAPARENPFERDDFDVVLSNEPTYDAPSPPPRRPPTPAPATIPAQPFARERSLPAPPRPTPVPAPLPLPVPAGLMLTPAKLILALVLVCLLVGLAFGGGVLVGRMLSS